MVDPGESQWWILMDPGETTCWIYVVDSGVFLFESLWIPMMEPYESQRWIPAVVFGGSWWIQGVDT